MRLSRKRYASFILGLACFVVIGCNGGDKEPQKLKVATVDIMRVLEEQPETVAIRLDWTSQRGDTAVRISELKSKEEADALRKEIAKRSEKWQKQVDAYMEKSVKQVEKSTAEIAKERGIDLVVVDNPLTHTVKYYDGEDISLDVSVKLQNEQ